MKLKIKHFIIYNNQTTIVDWEALRNNNNLNSYFLPYNKDEYLNKVETKNPTKLAKYIIQHSKLHNNELLISLGCGIAALEYQIKKFSNIQVTVSDNENSIYRLKNFNIFNDAVKIDALNDFLPINSNFYVLMSRIDTEFSDSELTLLFKKIHTLNIPFVYFIPAKLFTFKALFVQIKVHLQSFFLRKKKTFAGYIRNKSSFINIWDNYFEICYESSIINDLFVLKRKL